MKIWTTQLKIIVLKISSETTASFSYTPLPIFNKMYASSPKFISPLECLLCKIVNMEHITTCEITLFIIHCNLFYIYNSWSPLMACLFKLYVYYEWLSLKTKFIASQDFLTAMKDLQLLLELKSSCWTHHKVAESTLLNTCVHWHTSAHACTHIQIHPPNQTIHQSAIFYNQHWFRPHQVW